MKVMVKVFLSILLLLMLQACTTVKLYEGRNQPPENVIIINGMSNLDISALGYAAKVCEFNEKIFESCLPNIEFLPGSHRLVIESSLYGLTETRRENVKEFKAGERYRLSVGFKYKGVVSSLLGERANSIPTFFYIGKYNPVTKKVENK